MTEEGRYRHIKTRYFCTLCGKEFFGSVEGHFYLDHKDIRKRYLPLYDQTQINIHNGKELNITEKME